MFDRPQSGERAVLVHLVSRLRRRRPNGRVPWPGIVGRRAAAGLVTGTRRAPDARLFVGQGKAEEVKAAVDRGRGRRGDLRSCALPEPGTKPREGARVPRARPHGPDPRHLCAACPLVRRQAPGRARAAASPVDAPGKGLDPPGKATWRHRPARPGRNAARDRPPADRRPHHRTCDASSRKSTGSGPMGGARGHGPRRRRCRWWVTRTQESRHCSTG